MPRVTRDKPLISIIIPCYDEVGVIELTHRRLLEAIGAATAFAIELIYIDDGSRDDTLALLRTIQVGDGRVRVIGLSRNFGQPAAVTAGLAHARGDAVIIMDADLQDPPEVIPAMFERWREGAEVVYGVRLSRHGETIFKRWTAKAFFAAFKALSKLDVPSDTGYFRLLDRRVVDIVLRMPERDRFLHGMVYWIGLRQEPIFFHREPRAAGTTKYPLGKMLGLALDGFLSFSRAPLRTAAATGAIFMLLSLTIAGYGLTHRLSLGSWPSGQGWLLTGGLFFSGIQLLFLGVVGEYLGRVYDEVRHRPLYVVSDRLGFGPDAGESQHPGPDVRKWPP